MRKKIKDLTNYSIDEYGVVINDTTGQIKDQTSNHTGKGYLSVDLWKDGKRHRKYVHRLVAEAFLPNPENKPYINHKDGNPHNNFVNNLEWCTPLENVEHAAKQLGVMKGYFIHNEKNKRAIQGIFTDSGNKTRVYESVRQAEKETGIPASNIVANLKGRQSHTKGIVWCYVEELRK